MIKKQFKWGLCLIIILCMVFLNCITSFAHSGRTDSRGGHKDNINGGYHYHHGESAHQHPNGVCPYSSQAKNETPTTTKKQTTAPATTIAETTTEAETTIEPTTTVKETTRREQTTTKNVGEDSSGSFGGAIGLLALAACAATGTALVKKKKR